MTLKSFNEAAIGEKVTDLTMRAGAPYEVHSLGTNQQEYVYIERVSLSGSRELFRKYIFIISHDKIIGKRIEESTSSSVKFQF